jgi:hypothetical protein
MQAPLHAVPLVHCPPALQVCGVLPLHRVAPGAQTPVHEPLLHRKGQADPLVQFPLLSHVCGMEPLHLVEPGLQAVHWVAMQANGHTMLTVH